MNEVKRLARQLPVHKLRMTPLDYIRYFPRAVGTVLWSRYFPRAVGTVLWSRYFPRAVGTVLWERGKKVLKYVGVEL